MPVALLIERPSETSLSPFPRVDKPKMFIGVHEIEGFDEQKWLEYKLAKAASLTIRLSERNYSPQATLTPAKSTLKRVHTFASSTSVVARATSYWGFGRNFNR